MSSFKLTDFNNSYTDAEAYTYFNDNITNIN